MREEKILIGEDGGYPLEGILALPDLPAPEGGFPAVLLVHGSGPLDRDEKIGNQRPFRDIAEGLAERGIAALRYDKRTFVYGRRLVKEIKQFDVHDEVIDDALCATKLLKAHPQIDRDRVFIAGHSFGGMQAPRIDAEGGDYAGIIILAGTIRRLFDVIIDQNIDSISAMKWPLRQIADRQFAKFREKIEEYDALTEEESKSRKIIRINAYYFKDLDLHPVPDYLRGLKKPMLVLQGEKDFQVSVQKDFEAYREALKDSPKAEFRLYPGLGHTFTPSVYGEIKKYRKEYKVASKVDSKVIEDMTNWINQINRLNGLSVARRVSGAQPPCT